MPGTVLHTYFMCSGRCINVRQAHPRTMAAVMGSCCLIFTSCQRCSVPVDVVGIPMAGLCRFMGGVWLAVLSLSHVWATLCSNGSSQTVKQKANKTSTCCSSGGCSDLNVWCYNIAPIYIASVACTLKPLAVSSAEGPNFDGCMLVLCRCCNGRVVSVLEGGYNISGGIASAFARSVEAHVRGLAEPHSQVSTVPHSCSQHRSDGALIDSKCCPSAGSSRQL